MINQTKKHRYESDTLYKIKRKRKWDNIDKNFSRLIEQELEEQEIAAEVDYYINQRKRYQSD